MPSNDLYFWNIDFYGTDSWKVSSRLTINYGLRFEHLAPWSDRHGRGVPVFDPTTLDQTSSASLPLPGFKWHAIDPSVPMSGVSSRAFFYEPRVGFSYDLTGKGKTVLRGGYGQYRYHDSFDDVTNAVSETIGQQTSSITGNGGVTLAGIAKENLAVSTGLTAENTTDTTVYGLMPKDNQLARTQTYSVAIDQILPYKTQIEVSYIGNNSNHLLNDGGSNTANLDNVNALPYGALFAPDATGAIPTPYAVTQLSTSSIDTHRRYGTNPYDASTGTYGSSPYGSLNNYASIEIPQHTAYSNYNAIQAALSRQSGPLRYGVNYTFSKSLGILGAVGGGNPVNSTDLGANYGITPYDRSQIFNANYSYTVGTPVKSKLIGAFANGWEISGVTQIQSGQDLQVATGNPDFSPIVQLTSSSYTGTTSGTPTTVGSNGLTGTPDITLQPTLTCNPKSGLGSHQYINGSCFALGAQQTTGPIVNGPAFYPYMHGPMFFQSDLNASKSIHITERQALKLRISAFNFLNHPTYSFNSARPNEYSNITFQGTDPGTSTPQIGTVTPSGNVFGTSTLKQGRRVLEVSLKYSF